MRESDKAISERGPNATNRVLQLVIAHGWPRVNQRVCVDRWFSSRRSLETTKPQTPEKGGFVGNRFLSVRVRY